MLALKCDILKGHSLNTYATLEGGRVRTKLYKFVWGVRKGYLHVHTRFYETVMF